MTTKQIEIRSLLFCDGKNVRFESENRVRVLPLKSEKSNDFSELVSDMVSVALQKGILVQPPSS